MIKSKSGKKIYNERIRLLAPYYELNNNHIVGDIKLMDAMDIISSTANKLLKDIPSYIKLNRCSDFLCSEFSLDHSYEVLSLTAYEGKINVQEKINKYFTEKEYIECQSCKSNRIISISMKSYLLIELLSLPKDLEASSSFNTSDIGAIQKNYAGEVQLHLDSIAKTIQIYKEVYYLRGAVGFSGQDRWGLRVTAGHYKAFAYRSNDQWEVYDDLKDGVSLATKNKVNIEMLLYTK